MEKRNFSETEKLVITSVVALFGVSVVFYIIPIIFRIIVTLINIVLLIAVPILIFALIYSRIKAKFVQLKEKHSPLYQERMKQKKSAEDLIDELDL